MNLLRHLGFIAGAVIFLMMISSCDQADGNLTNRITLQKEVLRVEQFKQRTPADYKLIDWREKAEQFDKLAFDPSATGKFLPLIWEDHSYDSYGIPAYVGDPRMGRDGDQEAVTNIAAVLSGTLIGIDQSARSNYVQQLAP